MKKLFLLLTAILLSSSLISNAFGQTVDYLESAYRHIEEKYELNRAAVGDLKIQRQYQTKHNQVQHVILVQSYKGMDLFDSQINLAFLKDGNVISVGHNLVRMDKISLSSPTPKINAGTAIQSAAISMGMTQRAAPAMISLSDEGVALYDKSDISLRDIPVRIGYRQAADGTYRLVYSMEIDNASHGKLYQSYVDASTGESIANESLTISCQFDHNFLAPVDDCREDHSSTPSFSPLTSLSAEGTYRVIPVGFESPSHGNFELLSNVNDAMASPYGWHDTDGSPGPEHTNTQGNNVHAFLDRNWDYFPDGVVSGGDDLIFDFPYDDNAEPTANQNVAVTNLFYWNNIMHDFAYQYGFDEGAGNFQLRNYTGEGFGSDEVEAHAQFGDNNHTDCGNQANGGTPCVNNADFSSPTDGGNGRMRMFTWDRDNSSKYLDVVEPAELAGKILTGLPQFGPNLTTDPITAEVVEVNDMSFDPTKACIPINQPELEGKIAFIDRGVCDFSLKAYNAQQAGAIGAIIANFEDVVIPMGAGEMAASVTIPSVFISSVEADRIRGAIGQGLIVSLVAPESGGPILRDGSLDAGVIAHEYGHGISGRLTGGPGASGCLNNEEQMGEGWSDFFTLVTTVQPGDTGEKRRGIGTYANKEATNGRGIRSYPYSTDMSINPHTYDDILGESVPHGVGSVWCAMLWDLYWALSDEYGWDPDLYNGTGGNNMAIQLVMDGLKLQMCRPGFIEGRDAILEADMINNGGANQCLIWEVFARRGLGVNADGGSADSRADGKEGFDRPIACLDELRFSKQMTPEIKAGDNIEVKIDIKNYKDFELTNVFVEDIIPDGCTYLPGSANIEPVVGSTLVWSINSMDPDEELTITYLLATDPQNNSTRIYYDDMEGFADERWDITFDPNGEILNFWTQQDTISNSGVSAYRVGDPETESEHFLVNLDPYTISGTNPVYRFYNYHNTETGVDGGFLEISTASEPQWIPVGDRIFRNKYPRKLQYSTFAIPNLDAYSGRNTLDNSMEAVYIDMSDYIGEDVKVRFRFGSDDNTGGDGWYVDDVEIMDAILYNSEACLSSDQTPMTCAEAPDRGTIVDTEVTTGMTEAQSGTAFALSPNPAGNLLQIAMTSEVNETAQVRIYNLTGHLLSVESWGVSSGKNQKTLDLSELATGMYVLQIQTGAGLRAEKFVKE